MIIKSLADNRNLQVVQDGRVRVDSTNEYVGEQYFIETNYIAPGSVFYLVSRNTGNALHCSAEGLISTQTQNRGFQEAL